jgi:exodeoxyribonuclease VII large subunit
VFHCTFRINSIIGHAFALSPPSRQRPALVDIRGSIVYANLQMQPSLFAAAQWTVSTLTRYIRDALESDMRLQDIWVEGEVSNVSRPASGHVYFTLKDAGASLRCVMWRSSAARLELDMQDGMALAAHGKLGVYEASGQYQLYVDRLTPAGEGALYQEFLRLKAALEAEGLFDPERKRPIPALPGRIGIVTSATAAALRDVLNTLRRRMPLADVVLVPSAVQGEDAPAQLVEALSRLNALLPRPDVGLLVRGGGSIEDLWAFNDPRVVRSVAASEVPIVCGVGHETDFTLCDFAADLRAPTPTAAAELATQVSVSDLREKALAAALQLADQMQALTGSRRDALAATVAELRYHSPGRRIQSDRQRLDEFGRRVQAAYSHRLSLQISALEGWRRRLIALNPLEVLNRGYAVVTRRSDGAVVRRIRQATGGIHVRVSDGGFDADITDRGG